MSSTAKRAPLAAYPAPAWASCTGMRASTPAVPGGERLSWAVGAAAVRPDARLADAIRPFPVPGPSPSHRPA